MTVNKGTLVDAIAAKTNMSKKASAEALAATLDTIKDALADHKKVQLIGFGTFDVHHRAARKGRNPQTGAEIEIAATDAPHFKAGKGLKELVK